MLDASTQSSRRRANGYVASGKETGTHKVKEERVDSRIALYVTRSQRIALELIAEKRGTGLNQLLRELIQRGQETLEDEGGNNE